jgi:predicted methyltransferase
MVRYALALAAVLACSGSVLAANAPVTVPANIAAAVNDASRPAADKARDANRKPGESVAFSTMKPGDKVVDFLPGGGYFTRIFSKTVGPTGKVYAAVPAENMARRAQAADAVKAIAADPAYSGNTVVINPSNAMFSVPEPVDIVWTSDNYHDLKNGNVDMAALNKGIFNALKPGGVYYIIDHASAPGAGFTVTQSLHRSDPEAVKREVLAAGFTLEAEGNFLRNPEDNHAVGVNDGAIQGRTDQYVLRFRKPR